MYYKIDIVDFYSGALLASKEVAFEPEPSSESKKGIYVNGKRYSVFNVFHDLDNNNYRVEVIEIEAPQKNIQPTEQ